MCRICSCRLVKGENCMTLLFVRGRVVRLEGGKGGEGSEVARWERWESNEVKRWER